jgi:hypothetical protein
VWPMPGRCTSPAAVECSTAPMTRESTPEGGQVTRANDCFPTNIGRP